MRIAIGSDHRGTKAKRELVSWLTSQGHEVEDVGAHDESRVDYPDVAQQVAGRVSAADTERGVLLCGTGIGMAIAANKVPGVRAATVHNEQEAELSRRHNDLNVLCLSGETDPAELIRLLGVWLEAQFDGGRHAVRVEKISELESDRGC